MLERLIKWILLFLSCSGFAMDTTDTTFDQQRLVCGKTLILRTDPLHNWLSQLPGGSTLTQRVKVTLPKLPHPGYPTEKELLVLTPQPDQPSLEHYEKHILPHTVSLIAVDGWWTPKQREEWKRPETHSLIRVGKTLYQFNLIDGKNEAEMRADDYMAELRRLLTLQHQPTIYEALIPATLDERRALKNFYEARTNSQATIDGKTISIEYNFLRGGFGEWQQGGENRIEENCMSASLAFTQPYWWQDYPGLRPFTEKLGILEVNDREQGVRRPQFMAHTMIHGNYPAIVVWGKEAFDRAHMDLPDYWREPIKPKDWEKTLKIPPYARILRSALVTKFYADGKSNPITVELLSDKPQPSKN